MGTTTMGSGGQAGRPYVDMTKGVTERSHRCGGVGIILYHPRNELERAQHGCGAVLWVGHILAPMEGLIYGQTKRTETVEITLEVQTYERHISEYKASVGEN